MALLVLFSNFYVMHTYSDRITIGMYRVMWFLTIFLTAFLIWFPNYFIEKFTEQRFDKQV